MLQFSCSHCQTRIQTAAVHVGRQVRCPICNQALQVPETVGAPLEWYYAHDKQRHGPVSWEQLQQLAAKGDLQPTDMLWQKGTLKWQAAGCFPRLFLQTSNLPPTSSTPIVQKRKTNLSEDIFDEPPTTSENEEQGRSP